MFLAILTKIITSQKKTCKKKLVENFERNFLKKSVFRQIAYFLSYDVIMTSFLGIFSLFKVIFQNNHLFRIEKCPLKWENLSNFIKNCQKINKMHLLWLEMWFLINFDVWYHDFSPFETLILSILGYLDTLRTQYLRNGLSTIPQIAYKS